MLNPAQEMAEPSEHEIILQTITDVVGQKGAAGIQRKYDVIFTENGIAFAVVASGLKMAAQSAAVGGFGALGGAAAGSSVKSGAQKIREQFRDLSVKDILKLNEKSFYVSYSDINQITVKKGLLGVGKMNLELIDGKFQCQYSKNQLEKVKAVASKKLAARMKE